MRSHADLSYSNCVNVDSLIARIRDDLLTARKERDMVKSQALTAVVNAIDNASAVDVPADSNVTEVAPRRLSVDDVKEIIKNEIREMHEASAVYKDINPGQAAELEAKISILETYIETKVGYFRED